MPRRCSPSTAGLSATARNAETNVHTSTRRDTQTIQSTIATPTSTAATVTTVRGRKLTTRWSGEDIRPVLARARGGPNACQSARSHTRGRSRRPRSSAGEMEACMSNGDKPEPRVTLAAVTAWRGHERIRFQPTTLLPRRCTDPSLESLRGAPVWLDMDLEGTDACEWVEPWDRPKETPVSWSAIEPAAAALGFRVPGATPAAEAVGIGLERLVRLNEI